MLIVNIEYPGTCLEFTDKEKGFEIENLISAMETAVTDMAITLTMFITNQQESILERKSKDIKDSWELDNQLRNRIEQNYRATLPNEKDFYNNYDYHSAETQRIYRQEKLSSGVLPRSYKHRIAFIHAHSFLSAADTFSKYLSTLSTESELEHIKKLEKQFENTFPTLSKIRNSAQHSEDRSRGYGKIGDVRKKIKMVLKPISNEFIKAEAGGVLILSQLNGNRLGYTIDDGSYQEFEISQDTLAKFSDIFQSLINSFSWKGPNKVNPQI